MHQSTIDRELSFDGIEQLESRAMLAGNVTAVVTAAGDLVVRGDNNDNGMHISQYSEYALENGEIVETRLLTINSYGGQTTVNGEHGATFTLPEEGLRDVRINLRGGDDHVEFYRLEARNINANTGAGTDTVNVDHGQYSGNLRINLGSTDRDTTDAQSIRVFNTGIAGRLQIQGGNGADRVELTGGTASRVVLTTGAGDDLIHVAGAELQSRSRIVTGAGSDYVGIGASSVADSRIATGAGQDTVGFVDTELDSVSIATGGGDDTLVVLRVDGNASPQDVTANGGGGTNTLAGTAPYPVDNREAISRFEAATDTINVVLPQAAIGTAQLFILAPEIQTDEHGNEMLVMVSVTIEYPITFSDLVEFEVQPFLTQV